MAVQNLTEEQIVQLHTSVRGVMNKAVRAGRDELQLSGYDKLSAAKSVVLAEYVRAYATIFLKALEK